MLVAGRDSSIADQHPGTVARTSERVTLARTREPLQSGALRRLAAVGQAEVSRERSFIAPTRTPASRRGSRCHFQKAVAPMSEGECTARDTVLRQSTREVLHRVPPGAPEVPLAPPPARRSPPATRHPPPARPALPTRTAARSYRSGSLSRSNRHMPALQGQFSTGLDSTSPGRQAAQREAVPLPRRSPATGSLRWPANA